MATDVSHVVEEVRKTHRTSIGVYAVLFIAMVIGYAIDESEHARQIQAIEGGFSSLAIRDSVITAGQHSLQQEGHETNLMVHEVRRQLRGEIRRVKATVDSVKTVVVKPGKGNRNDGSDNRR